MEVWEWNFLLSNSYIYKTYSAFQNKIQNVSMDRMDGLHPLFGPHVGSTCGKIAYIYEIRQEGLRHF